MYKCLGCLKLYKYEEASYEITQKGTYKSFVICKECDNIQKLQWQEKPIPPYEMIKIHTYSNEYNDYWKMVDKEIPNWEKYHVTEDGMIFTNGNKQLLLPQMPADKCICCDD